MKLFDVTRPIFEGMIVYEGDPRVVVRRVASVAAGACANVSEVVLGSHTGTHVDPPLHFREGAPGVDALPLEVLTGPAHVYALEGCEPIDVVDLRRVDLRACPRVLFKAGAGVGPGECGSPPASAGMTVEAARALVEAGVRLVGLDGASVDPPGADPMDVMFSRSTNNGQTWSPPLKINDGGSGANLWQWFGTLSVAPNGRIDVIWNDTRNNPQPGVKYWSQVYYATSGDGGLT